MSSAPSSSSLYRSWVLFWRQQFPSPDTKPSPISHNVSQPSFETFLDLPGRLERLVEDPSIDAVVAADILTGLIVRRDVDPQTSVCPGYTPSRLNEAMIRRLLSDTNLPDPVVLGESMSSGDASIWNDLVDLLELWKGIVDPLSKEEIRFSQGLCLVMAFLPTVGVLETSCVPKLALDLDRAVGWKSSTQELIRRHLLILICRFIREEEGGEERRLLRIRFVEPYLIHFCLAALRKRIQEKGNTSSSITSPVAAASPILAVPSPHPYYTPADHPIKVLIPGESSTSGESYWRNATILEPRCPSTTRTSTKGTSTGTYRVRLESPNFFTQMGLSEEVVCAEGCVQRGEVVVRMGGGEDEKVKITVLKTGDWLRVAAETVAGVPDRVVEVKSIAEKERFKSVEKGGESCYALYCSYLSECIVFVFGGGDRGKVKSNCGKYVLDLSRLKARGDDNEEEEFEKL